MAATINLNAAGSSTKTYVVNADGNLLMGTSFTWATGNAVVSLLGGAMNVNGSINGGLTNDANDYVSFEALGSTFTAAFGGQLPDVAAVEANIGAGKSFRATTGLNLELTDNGTTFTITAGGPPISTPGTLIYGK